MSPTLFALDFDGVVADTTPLIETHYIGSAIANLRQRFGARVPDDATLWQLMKEQWPIHHCSMVILAHHFGLPKSWVEEQYATIPATIPPEALAYLQPDPRLKGLLEELKARGDTICILTQSHTSHVALVTRQLDIHKVFKNAYIFDRTATPGHTKRGPEPYLKLLAHHGHREYGRKIMVEDSAANLPAAKATGFEAALVGPQWQTGQPADHRAPIIHTLLEAYLEGHLPPPA